MRCYLAASWSRRDEILQASRELNAIDVMAWCHWLHDEDEMPTHGQEKFLRENALCDVNDVSDCDVFVRFSDDLTSALVPSHLATGGRMFEMGLAYALGKPIYVVGGKQNIFDRLPNIIHVKDFAHLKRELSPVEVN